MIGSAEIHAVDTDTGSTFRHYHDASMEVSKESVIWVNRSRDGGGRRVLSREMEVGGGYSVERLRTKYEEREPGDGECMHEI